MKRVVLVFVLGAAAGGFCAWYALEGPYAVRIERSDVERASDEVAEATDEAVETARRGGDAALEVLELEADDLRGELAERGRVVRRTALQLGEIVADEAADARITTEIEAKLVAHPELSSLAIDVETEQHRVTLSGTATRPEEIGEAILIAYRVDGVQEVVSTIQLADDEEPAAAGPAT